MAHGDSYADRDTDIPAGDHTGSNQRCRHRTAADGDRDASNTSDPAAHNAHTGYWHDTAGPGGTHSDQTLSRRYANLADARWVTGSQLLPKRTSNNAPDS